MQAAATLPGTKQARVTLAYHRQIKNVRREVKGARGQLLSNLQHPYVELKVMEALLHYVGGAACGNCRSLLASLL